MRNLISTFAGFTLLAGVASHQAAADVQTPHHTVTVTAGQGGSMTIVLPPQAGEATNAGPDQAIAVTAGQAGSIRVVVPGPGGEALAAAKVPAKNAVGPQMTMLQTDANK